VKARRLRDIERFAIQQWVADNFGKHRMAEVWNAWCCSPGISRRLELEAPLALDQGWSLVDGGRVDSDRADSNRAPATNIICSFGGRQRELVWR